jgi:hypothetical protein
MILPANSDFALEQAAAKDAADKKAAALKVAEIAIEKSRVQAAVALARAVEREARIDSILTLEGRVTALENRARSSAEILDNKIVACDSPIHWIKRNVWTVVSIVVANAAITGLMIYFLR